MLLLSLIILSKTLQSPQLYVPCFLNQFLIICTYLKYTYFKIIIFLPPLITSEMANKIVKLNTKLTLAQ